MLTSRPGRKAVTAFQALAIVFGSSVAFGPSALAEPDKSPSGAPAASSAAGVSNAQLLDDFTHYVKIAQVVMAKATAEAILARSLKPAEFLGLVEENPQMAARFDDAYRRALAMPELEGVAASLNGLYEEGRRTRARLPAEIDRNIALLTRDTRAQLIGTDRLKEAKEYAVPQLLEAMQNAKEPAQRGAAQRMLIDLGRDAVAPLTAALPHLSAQSQELVAQVLGAIPYRMSAPFLYELLSTTTNDRVKAAVRRAIERIDGSVPADVNVGDLFRRLGDDYYSESRTLTSFSGEAFQPMWSWVSGVGLEPTAIRTEVFHEAMAMRLAEKALALTPGDQPALSLWLASNFRREIQTPEGYDNPAYPPSRRPAMYYAVAAGGGPLQAVLDRALRVRDTLLARRAIEAIAQSGTGPSMWAGPNRPLVEALSYPDRRVQFEAALAIGRANPSSPFEGSERVVAILASAVRDAKSRYGVVVARDLERQQVLRKVLEAQGFTVVAPARALADAASSIAAIPGVDALAFELSGPATADAVDAARVSPRLRAAPILAVLPFDEMNRLATRFEADGAVAMVREGAADEQLGAALAQIVKKASGPAVTDEEAARYAGAAIDTLRDLALSRSTTLNPGEATGSLITALGETKGELRQRVAEVLGMIGEPRAQSAVMDAALSAGGDEQVKLLGIMSASAKRHGNMLEARQIDRLIELVEKGTGEQATAASALMGALNLPNSRLVPLITSQK
ncbi:MAG: HEAT repeat domain-containing protein [Phycisphaerales bacterium]|nr:HEAT repeat domain-containing protein [Phycisphaerales bacterium]